MRCTVFEKWLKVFVEVGQKTCLVDVTKLCLGSFHFCVSYWEFIEGHKVIRHSQVPMADVKDAAQKMWLQFRSEMQDESWRG